jgi:hypothetical protein
MLHVVSLLRDRNLERHATDDEIDAVRRVFAGYAGVPLDQAGSRRLWRRRLNRVFTSDHRSVRAALVALLERLTIVRVSHRDVRVGPPALDVDADPVLRHAPPRAVPVPGALAA